MTEYNLSRRSFRPFKRSILSVFMAPFFVVLAGCAGDLSQTFKQSLSVVSPKKIDFMELEYYANRSKSSYDPIDKIRQDYPLVTRVVTVQTVDVQYFIETDLANQQQTLSIRGTAEKPNVWEDIETTLIADSILSIPLHRGFQEDAKAVFSDAAPYLRKDLRLRVNGHSLGGAVAVIVAAYLLEEGYTIERVVTFGQPKFTSEPPPEQVMSVTTRVINDLDVVPMIPPFSINERYQHFAPEVILREGSDYVYLDEHDADRLSVGEFWRDITDFSFREHHVDGYLSNIQEKVMAGSRQVPYLFK